MVGYTGSAGQSINQSVSQSECPVPRTVWLSSPLICLIVRRMVKNLKRRQKAVDGSRDVPVAQGSVGGRCEETIVVKRKGWLSQP